jgi:hypothetical protein
MRPTGGLAPLVVAALALQACATAPGADRADRPIRAVAAGRLTVTTGAGRGEVAVYVSRDWEQPQPGVTRAVVLFHGLRGRDVFLGTAPDMARVDAARDALLIAPQFLTDVDAQEHRLPGAVLRWPFSAASGGGVASGPAPIGSFEVIDAILTRLADRTRFPRLTRVILAGHSAGAQLVQRYAVVGHGARLADAGLSVRYVVASPSSYLYFSEERPTAAGALAPFERARCGAFNRWKYGLEDAPAYVGATPPLEAAYARREVIYLLAAADDDPNDPSMAHDCAAEAQGPDRLTRGHAYMRYLSARHPEGLNHRLWEVPDVAHHTRQVFTSPCGLAAVFERGTCGP